MIKNPFPGPQPYRASDRERFYGREEIAYKLECSLLSNHCVTVHGPSGAGKSSLLQAAVIPTLIAHEDVRVVRVDAWPEEEDATRWMARAMYNDLGFGELPAELPSSEAVLAAAKRAARGSSRLMLVYLDQIEQLLAMDRALEETESFFACLQDLVELPLRTVRVILSLREDYLGRFRDRLRDRQRMLDSGFRVGPLSVADLTQAVCKAAAAGEPSQAWSPDQMRALMLQVRVPGQAATDEAEAQSAYAQIVCRALFQQRAQGDAAEGYPIEAAPILRGYLETTLSNLGPLREAAQRLLEDHLVTADGSRTLRTEKELHRTLPAAELSPILRALEGAAILHAEEHQGSRYFEIGHDWLAHKVFEQRQEREQLEAQRRREEEQQREIERQREEGEVRLGKARRQRRVLAVIAGASLVFAAVTGALGVWASQQSAEAQAQKVKAEEARRDAVKKRIEAYDQRVLAGFLALTSQGESAWAMKLLPEVKRPAERLGWVSYASDALTANALRVTLRGHTASLRTATFSPSGERVLTASNDGTARVWSADGKGEPVVLKGHKAAITFAAFSPEGQRVLTTSEDGTARVWSADGKGEHVVLKGAQGDVVFGAWSADGKRVVTAAHDGTAWIYAADGSDGGIELRGHKAPLTCAMFLPDGGRVVTASEDGTARVWNDDAKSSYEELKGHGAAVLFVTASPDGKWIVTASRDKTARVFRADGKGTPVVLKGHEGEVVHAAVSPDGKRVATASGDRTARLWNMDGTGLPVVLSHALAVTHVAFHPKGQLVATASIDKTARIWSTDDGDARLVLQGHSAPLRTAVWSPDGRRLLTAAEDRTAKVWSADRLESLPRERRDAGFFHAAAISLDGKIVVAAYDDKAAHLRHVDGTGETVEFKRPDAWVANAALSPSGDRVVTASFDKTARVWSADGKGEPVVLKGHEAEVRFAAVSPDGKRVVTASDDRTARVFQADGSGAPVVLTGHEDWLTSTAVSPDDKRVVTTSLDRTARVWNIDGSGAPVVLKGHEGAVYAAAWSPDGKRIVTASEDGAARIWSAESGGSIELRGRGGAMLRAAFSADGKRVAASSVDGLIHVWRADGKGQPIVLRVGSPAIALSFVDDNQRLLTVASDQRTHTWMIDVGQLIDGLKSAHADCLPAEVRLLYLGETEMCAQHAFAACESAYGRGPAPGAKPPGCEGGAEPSRLVDAEPDGGGESATAEAAQGDTAPSPSPSSPKDSAPNGPRVKVIVLPGDAEVEIAGVTTRRRDGIVELTGKVGEVRRLRVIKGTHYIEQDVTIQDGGGSPLIIDLMAKIALKAGPPGKKPSKPGDGVWDALMPSSFDDKDEPSKPKPRGGPSAPKGAPPGLP